MLEIYALNDNNYLHLSFHMAYLFVLFILFILGVVP